MKWITIGQYFYRLYIAVLLILMVPIFSFISVYVFFSSSPIQTAAFLFAPLHLFLFMIAILVIQFLIFNKKIKSIRKDQGLRAKLEKYSDLTIVRYSLIAAVCLVLAYGFYLTKDDVVTGMFAFTLILLAVLWPRSAKVCRDLKLRGDEREMVYYKKDHF
jgi:hypothetical protein